MRRRMLCMSSLRNLILSTCGKTKTKRTKALLRKLKTEKEHKSLEQRTKARRDRGRFGQRQSSYAHVTVVLSSGVLYVLFVFVVSSRCLEVLQRRKNKCPSPSSTSPQVTCEGAASTCATFCTESRSRKVSRASRFLASVCRKSFRISSKCFRQVFSSCQGKRSRTLRCWATPSSCSNASRSTRTIGRL